MPRGIFFLAIRALMLILTCQLFSASDKQDFRPFYFTSDYTNGGGFHE